MTTHSERQRRSRRKKKKQQGKLLLWAILGGVLVVLVIVGAVVLVNNLPQGGLWGGKGGVAQGQGDGPGNQGADGKGGNQGPNAQGGVEMSLVSKVKKKIDFIDWQNEMRQIAQYYNLYFNDFGRAPKTVKDFQDYIKKDYPELVKLIDAGYYVIIPNQKLSSHSIVAYQNKDLRFGTRYIVRGDGSFDELPEADFQAQLQQQGQ